MTTPKDLKYTKSHEWVKAEPDGTVTVGITFHAQEQLGDIVFVQHPDVGRKLKQGEECAVIESVKAAGELKAPVAGVVTEINEILADEPERVNSDATGEGWFMRMNVSDAAELDDLMDEDAYQAYVESLG
jgi:glycine cleavage system H protein